MVATPGRPVVIERASRAVEPQNLGDPGDSGNILAHRSGYILLVSGGAETRTLDDPVYPGQLLDLFFETDGGDCVITADSAINQAANTIMTFADAGDHIRLVGGRDGAGDYEWRVVANDGVALS
jgi:hypothetical protein